MLARALSLSCLLLTTAVSSAVTVEVVQLFQPLSLHGTDGVGDEEEGEDPIQATVLSRPVAVSGAVPEDLVKAVAMPHAITSNTPAYDVKEANLLVLCKVSLVTEMRGGKLIVRLDVSEMVMPEELDVTARQVLRLTIVAIRRTLKDYYKHSDDELEVSIGVIGTNEGNEALQDLANRFTVGG